MSDDQKLGIDCDLHEWHPQNRARNQTVEHEELKHRALRWIASQCRPHNVRGSVEIALTQGYVADAFSLCSLQQRFIQRYEGFWGLKERTYVHRVGADNQLVRDARGDFDNFFACIFEVKVSRADFLKTFRAAAGPHANRHTPIASLHWCCTPKGMIDQSELPEFWGLLEAAGRGMKEIRPPRFNPIKREMIDRFAYQLLFYGQREWLRIKQCPVCLNDYPDEKPRGGGG